MTVLILAEHDGQKLKTATRQAVSAARAFGLPVTLVLFGDRLSAVAEEAARVTGVLEVKRIEAPHLAHILPEDVAPTLAELARDARALIAAHTPFAKNILPRVAALLDVAMVSDVVKIESCGRYVRPIYAGNLLATVENPEPVQLVTVRATAFDVAGDGGSANVETLAAPAPNAGLAEFKGESLAASERPDLASARVVVSGGRSLASAERFDALLGPLAGKLDAALGATRAAVDEGIAPNDWQVGQTGSVVAPELYLAIGVSGAVQHLAGMKDSKVIVAINRDPDAPIFQVADYGLVADLFDAVPKLSAALA
ncbi:electron transfer flavoprotein subunit alpha/FixB family protein [Crenobacter cavernae]|uniref:Electron transfer flavoprotein subunit alpha/FixB family protein n=1 Tax=Crenobacter cavernae TaxID=2290923 RepID=A0ABY0FD54_9NEIS|nr:FAD-binding protein [Crenobacter cavernae]RXZ42116.1 electron transfer flavoprotein subunit alpha/FixB family protein [Crenobacter cavernae]